MSTDKHGTKRSSTTKEKNALPKTTTSKTSKARTVKQVSETQKTTSDKTSDDKELLKKSKTLTRDLVKERNVASKRPENKSSQKTSVPSKTSSNLNTSSSSRGSVSKTATSSSSRVKTSQYFPSKNLYSNALKSVKMQSKTLEDDSEIKQDKATPRSTTVAKKLVSKNSPRSAISKPSKIKNSPKITNEIKRTPRDSSPDTSSAFERPRTATLRKGSIVNENIVGPEAPSYAKTIPAIKETVLQTTTDNHEVDNDDNYYDDDFESYESDFEADTSSDDTNLPVISGETSSMSSSAEDISEKRNSSPPKDTNKRLSSAGTDSERKLDSGTFELTDFKHRQILKYIEDTMKRDGAILEQENLKERINHHSLSDEGFEDQKSLQFINFADAKKKCEKRRASAARRKRGEELLGMIKLDAINFTIFDSPSVPYDVYITNYGQGNSVQASVQTGDDDLCEEVQTDAITESIKWTQMPIKFSSFDESKEHFWGLYKTEYLGVGGEEADDLNQPKLDINEGRLAYFLKHSGDLILSTLSEETMNNIENLTANKNQLPFSEGYLQFNIAENIFKNTTVQSVSVHSKNIGQVLTVHIKSDVESDFIKSIICVWGIENLNAPRTALVAFGEVSCATFSLKEDNYILAGQNDGAVLVWSIEDKHKIYNISSRTPSFTTPIGSGHVSKITSLQPMSHDQTNAEAPENNEVCSLDDAGTIIIWTLYTNPDSRESINGIVLINTQAINLQAIYPHLSDMLCSDCIIVDNHIYVSSNYGFILHHLVRSNQVGIKIFIPETNIDATCLESCPFSPSYFLAGYSNGDVSLYSRTNERPLLVLQNKEQIDGASIQMIQWSKTKPFLFYAKDSANTINIWDLYKSDMYPEYSITFPESISCMKLSPVVNIEKDESAYMLIGTESGNIYLHLLRKEYGQESFEKYQEHVKIFLKYVSCRL